MPNAAIPDPETPAAFLRSANIKLWQHDLGASSLATIENGIDPDDCARVRDALLACGAVVPIARSSTAW